MEKEKQVRRERSEGEGEAEAREKGEGERRAKGIEFRRGGRTLKGGNGFGWTAVLQDGIVCIPPFDGDPKKMVYIPDQRSMLPRLIASIRFRLTSDVVRFIFES
jgi:hypothetical protein